MDILFKTYNENKEGDRGFKEEDCICLNDLLCEIRMIDSSLLDKACVSDGGEMGPTIEWPFHGIVVEVYNSVIDICQVMCVNGKHDVSTKTFDQSGRPLCVSALIEMLDAKRRSLPKRFGLARQAGG